MFLKSLPRISYLTHQGYLYEGFCPGGLAQRVLSGEVLSGVVYFVMLPGLALLRPETLCFNFSCIFRYFALGSLIFSNCNNFKFNQCRTEHLNVFFLQEIITIEATSFVVRSDVIARRSYELNVRHKIITPPRNVV